MAPEIFRQEAPPTRILSMTESTPEQVQELPPQETEVKPEIPPQLVEQPETIIPESETLNPKEPPEEPEELLEKRFKDTQKAFHDTRDELKELKDMMSAMVAEKNLREMAQIGQQQQIPVPALPSSFSMPEPTEEEKTEPWRYSQRLATIQRQVEIQERTHDELANFMETHPDYKNQEVFNKMMEISQEMPEIFAKGSRPLHKVYKIAQERLELEGYRDALKEAEKKGIEIGAGMERDKVKSGVFTKPSGGSSPRVKPTLPDYNGVNPITGRVWTSAEMKEDMRRFGMVKDNF